MKAGISGPGLASRQALWMMLPISALMLANIVACDSKTSSSSSSSNNANVASEASGSDVSDDSGTSGEPVFGTAAIAGKVMLDGEAPPKKKIAMNGDRYCEKHDKEHVAPKLEVGKDGGLPHVFVYIKKGISAKYPAPAATVELDQTGCMYEPHVFGLQVGQTLNIKNNDSTAHNVHALPKKNTGFNIAQPRKDIVNPVIFKRPEVMIKFKCDVHGWMDAYCGVLNHPFFAVTDADGNFKIDKLPAGKYTIEAWHEMYGTRTMEVEVGDGESGDIKFEFGKGR